MRRPGRKATLSDLEAHDPNHSYAYAVSLLARRDYSTRELRQKLKERGYGEGAIEPVLIDLGGRLPVAAEARARGLMRGLVHREGGLLPVFFRSAWM